MIRQIIYTSFTLLFCFVTNNIFSQDGKNENSSPYPVTFDAQNQNFIQEKTEKPVSGEKQNLKNYQEEKTTIPGGSTDTKENKNIVPTTENKAIILAVREKDVFKSSVIAKHVTPEKLNELKLKNPDNIDNIDFYYNKSFSIEVIPGTPVEQNLIDGFVKNFDPNDYESKRFESESSVVEFPESGVKVILLPFNDLPQKIQKYLLKSDDAGCVGCKNGRKMPHNKEIILNKQ